MTIPHNQNIYRPKTNHSNSHKPNHQTITFDQIWFCAPKKPQATKPNHQQLTQGMSSHKNTSGTKKQNQRPGVFPNLTRSFKEVTLGLFWGPRKNQMKWGMDFRVPCFCAITLSWTQKHKKNTTHKNYTLRLCFFEWIRYFVGKSIVVLRNWLGVWVVDHGIKSRFFSWDFFFGWFSRDGLVGSPRGVHGICKTKIWKILAYDKHTVRVSKTGITSFHALWTE